MTRKKGNKMHALTMVHFILQAKGGIGKSYVSKLLAELFRRMGLNIRCFDLDQENTTFAGFSGLGVQHINVYDADRTVDPKKFDSLMEILLTQQGTFVIDTGANTFSSLLSYMVENNVIELLEENGRKVFIHTIVGGGAELEHTASGFNSIANGTSAPIVLWLNEHFGDLEIQAIDESGTAYKKPFTETKVFSTHSDRLAGVVLLRARNHKTTGEDVRKMNMHKLTIDEVMESQKFTIMEKNRIKIVADDVFSQLVKIDFS